MVVSFGLSLVGTTVLLLRYLNSAPLEWARQLAGDLGAIGDLLFPVFVIVVYGALVLVVAAIIRWLLLTVQRALVSPARINSAESCARVLDTIVARVRHRATTLTLGPMPVIAVDDAGFIIKNLKAAG